MANHWLRLWHDMPHDPKWRTIARHSGEAISLVQAVYLHLLVDASRNVTRGHASVTTEDLASALDCDESQIEAILSAMQGRVLDGLAISGWSNRQPQREDSGDGETGAKSASQRKREQRERERLAKESAECHAASRNVTTDKDKDTDTEEKQEAKASSSSAAPIDQTSELAQRLAKVTDEAIGAFNASALTKRNGGPLPNVSATVGREKRQQQVRRCLRTARAICLESTGDPRVTPEFWAAYFDLVAGDDFYSGRLPGGAGHENYVPDFELLTREATMVKLYDRQVAA